MKNTQKGFTLIELLVVIAIIGILSSIVIASLNSARTKGKDAAIKGQLKQLQTQAEVFYDNNGGKYATTTVVGATSCTTASSGTFAGSLFSNTSAAQQIAQIASNDAPNSSVACAISSNGQLWGLSITGLNGGGSYCLDNSGNFKASSTLNTGTAICG
jgi:type IV pilus assembly protein PilA